MSITESQTEDFSQDSVMNARLTWLRIMNSLTSLIFGTRDITLEAMIFGVKWCVEPAALQCALRAGPCWPWRSFRDPFSKVSLWIFNDSLHHYANPKSHCKSSEVESFLASTDCKVWCWLSVLTFLFSSAEASSGRLCSWDTEINQASPKVVFGVSHGHWTLFGEIKN